MLLQSLFCANYAPCDQLVNQEARAKHEGKALLHKLQNHLSDKMHKINYISLYILYPETCPNPGKLGSSIRERLLLYDHVSLIQMPVGQVYNTV